MQVTVLLFLPSPHVLVDGVLASPYMGAHVGIARWQHAVLMAVHARSPHATTTQAFVTLFAIPFVLLNNLVQSVVDAAEQTD